MTCPQEMLSYLQSPFPDLDTCPSSRRSLCTAQELSLAGKLAQVFPGCEGASPLPQEMTPAARLNAEGAGSHLTSSPLGITLLLGIFTLFSSFHLYLQHS